MTELKNNPRDLAVDALESIDEGAYSNLELNQVIQDADLSEVDKHLLTELVYGVLQHRLTIDFYLANFLQRPDPAVGDQLITYGHFSNGIFGPGPHLCHL